MCNFNYKVRQDSGHMGIFEVNTRVGADLACDVPRERAKAFFEKRDKLETSFPHVLPAAAPALSRARRGPPDERALSSPV